MILDVRRAAAADFERVQAFYERVCYRRAIGAEPVVFVADLVLLWRPARWA